MNRRVAVVGLLALLLTWLPGHGHAESVLRVGMTAANVPVTFGQPDNGFEGFRFIGYTIYDALINWDLSSSDKPTGLVPGLAQSWAVDAKDKTKWTFHLRKGVKFHDGSEFTADAVIFNFDKLFKKDSPQYDARQASLVNFRIPSVKSYRKVDTYTVEFTTNEPDAFFPFQICYIVYASPQQWAKTGKDWSKFAFEPSGTGPWKLTKLAPRERAELARNAAYWDKKRVPKADKLVLIPIPEATTRTAALLSGQVDWIEAPSPDAVPRLKSAGMQIITNVYPHIWSYHLSRLPDSPWNDIRVRKAANLAVDRAGLTQLLGGLMAAAKGHMPVGDPWFGRPSFDLKYDPAQAKALLAQAGYSPSRPVKAKILISASGSGQMQPLPMNEFIQQNFKDVGIEVEFVVMEWQSLLDQWRAGAKAPANPGGHAINVSYATQEPFSAFTRLVYGPLHAPDGVNWGWLSDPKLDDLLEKAKKSFDPEQRDRYLAEVHTYEVDNALFVWVAHDLNPRALSPKVKGFVQARNWFQDLTPVTVAQ